MKNALVCFRRTILLLSVFAFGMILSSCNTEKHTVTITKTDVDVSFSCNKDWAVYTEGQTIMLHRDENAAVYGFLDIFRSPEKYDDIQSAYEKTVGIPVSDKRITYEEVNQKLCFAEINDVYPDTNEPSRMYSSVYYDKDLQIVVYGRYFPDQVEKETAFKLAKSVSLKGNQNNS